MCHPNSPEEFPHQSLRRRTSGAVLLPDDSAYHEAREVWNGMIDREPGAIVQCQNPEDVATAVNFARSRDLLFAVKSGGHDFAGKSVCDGGLLIDLSKMDSVQIDPQEKTLTAGPGATWDAVYSRAEQHGLLTAGGPPRIGVAGLTLGGGIGPLSRKFGLTVDNLLAAEVVTADGSVVRASETDHSELLWGIRGGCGNFGIVTSFTYDLHEIDPTVIAGVLYFSPENLREKLKFYDRLMTDAPDELTCSAVLHDIGPIPYSRDEFEGETVIGFKICYCGDVDEGQSILDNFARLGSPIVNTLQVQPFTEFNQEIDRDVERFFPKSHFVDELTEDAIDTIVAFSEDMMGTYTTVTLGAMGGAVNRVERSETAFPHRDAAYEFDIWAGWSDATEDEEILSWVREFHESMEPYASGGVYVNQLNSYEDHRVEAAYGSNYERLARLKARWDPDNVFRMTHNVEPADN